MLSIKTERQQTFVNIISGILAMLVNLGVNFFLSPYIVKTLGEEANGFTQLANNFVTYASMITIAFNSMAGRFISVNYHQGKHEKVKTYYSSVVLSNLVISLFLFPIAIYIINNLESLIVIENAEINDVKILFTCVFINFFVNLIISVYNISMFVTNSLYYQNILNLARYVLNGVLLFCAFSILPAKIYYVSLAALVLTVIVLVVSKRIHKKLMPEFGFSISYFQVEAVKEMVMSGIWNTVNQCGNMLMTGLDLLVCNLFISPAAMGVLSVAKIIPNSIIGLATLLNNNFAPALTINFAKGDNSQLLKQLRSNMKISSVIVSVPIITFCSFGIPFYSLWMPTMRAEELTLLSFLTCMAFIPWAGPQTLYNVFTATNHLKVNSVAFVSTGFLNVGVVFLCLKYTNLGIIAVAGTSSVLSILRNLTITAPYIAKLLNLRWNSFYKDVAISLICCGINYIVAYCIRKLCNIDTWGKLIVCVILTCIVTVIIDMLFVLNRKERKLFFEKVRRK